MPFAAADEVSLLGRLASKTWARESKPFLGGQTAALDAEEVKHQARREPFSPGAAFEEDDQRQVEYATRQARPGLVTL
jgi:hypothetical protein